MNRQAQGKGTTVIMVQSALHTSILCQTFNCEKILFKVSAPVEVASIKEQNMRCNKASQGVGGTDPL